MKRPNPKDVNPYDSKAYNRTKKRTKCRINPKDVNPYDLNERYINDEY